VSRHDLTCCLRCVSVHACVVVIVWRCFQEPELAALRSDVVAFARSFPAVGFDEAKMKFPEEPTE